MAADKNETEFNEKKKLRINEEVGGQRWADNCKQSQHVGNFSFDADADADVDATFWDENFGVDFDFEACNQS